MTPDAAQCKQFTMSLYKLAILWIWLTYHSVDFNQLRDSFLRVHYGYAQLVNVVTRNGAILDKIWSNMSPVYAHPAVLSELGSSDHRMVLLVPSSYPTLDTGMIQNRVIRRMGATERMTFVSALCLVRWEYMYLHDGFVRAAVSVLSRNYDRTNRHVFSTEDGYKAQFRQIMGYRSLSTSDQTEATRTNVG